MTQQTIYMHNRNLKVKRSS